MARKKKRNGAGHLSDTTPLYAQLIMHFRDRIQSSLRGLK